MNNVNAPGSNFPAFMEGINYAGVFGIGTQHDRYTADCVELAISRDAPAMLDECIARGWLTPECRTFANNTVVERCDHRGATKCAAHLRALGWP